MKKILSLILSLAMVMSLATVAWAAGVTSESDLENALSANGEVVLGGNFTVSDGVTVPAGVTVTLDLAGCTVTMNAAVSPSALITNNGTLIIKDSVGGGALSYNTTALNVHQSTSTIINTDTGVLTINGGTIENTTPDSGGSGAAYAIDNYGVLTINDGTFTSNRITLRQAEFNGGTTNSVTINGGDISGTTAALQIHAQNNNHSMTTVINGGTLSGDYAFYTTFVTGKVDGSNVSISVDGGEFEGAVYVYNKNNGGSEYPMDVDITGGSFEGPVYIYTKDSSGTVVNMTAISGGDFSDDVSDYLAPGVIQNANGEVVNPNAGTTGGTQVSPLGAATKPVKGNGLANNNLYTYSKEDGLQVTDDDTVPFGTALYALLTDEGGYPVKSDAVKGLNVSDKWTENGAYVKDVEIVKVGNHYAIAIYTTGSSLEEVQVLGNIAVKGKSLYKDAQGKSQKADVKFDVDVEIGLAWPEEDAYDGMDVTVKTLYDFEGLNDEEFGLTFGPFDVETDTKGMKKVLMSYNDDEVEAIVDEYPEADLEFVNCEANFRRTAIVTIDLEYGPFVYEIVDGKLVEVNGEYDDWAEEFTFKTRRLGSYVISDTELVVEEVVVANPSTGAAA